MPSRAYGRIRDQVVAIVEAIPPGRVTTFRTIGDWLAVMPRHVAFVLSKVARDPERSAPWHRVVQEAGALGRHRFDSSGLSQQQLLAAEGVTVTSGTIDDFDRHYVTVAELDAGVRFSGLSVNRREAVR